MKNVLMVFMMACFCLIATSSISAQNYVGQEEASIRLKNEIQELTVPTGDSFVAVKLSAQNQLKVQFMNHVLDELPQSSSEFNNHIDGVFEVMRENANDKEEIILNDARDDVKRLLLQ